MSKLQTIQNEVGQWSEENFGAEQPSSYPLMGAAEEIGELIHSVLKRLQGIRLDEESVGTEAEVDAIGDTAIYLLDFLYREGLDIQEGIDGNAKHFEADTYDEIELIGEIFMDYAHIWTNHPDDHSNYWCPATVMSIFNALDAICELREDVPRFRECVEVAWYGEVQDREWDADMEVQ